MQNFSTFSILLQHSISCYITRRHKTETTRGDFSPFTFTIYFALKITKFTYTVFQQETSNVLIYSTDKLKLFVILF